MRSLSILLLSVSLFLVPPRAAAASDDPLKDYEESVFMDMELHENINTPAVPKKAHGFVEKKMGELKKRLENKKYNVEMMRDDEVVIVTIPSDRLFLPNDTLLTPEATSILAPLVAEVTPDPLRYKLLYTVHTDNTGSEFYNNLLSQQRNNSIYDWLLPQVSDELIIIPYEMGDTDPVESNDSRLGRAANRRIEFYFVPGPSLISGK